MHYIQSIECPGKKKKQQKTFKKWDSSGILKVSAGILKENENCRFLKEM